MFPGLKNLVLTPTYKNKVLDVIVTNLHSLYDPAMVFPPIQPDSPAHGAPSDHCVAVVSAPINLSNRLPVTKSVIRSRRNVSAPNLAKLSSSLSQVPWEEMDTLDDVDLMRDYFSNVVESLVNLHCPVIKIKVRENPKINVSSKLAALSIEKSRVFKRKGNCEEFKRLKKAIDIEKKETGRRDIAQTFVPKQNNAKAWMNLVGRLSSHISLNHREELRLPSHVEKQLTATEEANVFGSHFSKMSEE